MKPSRTYIDFENDEQTTFIIYDSTSKWQKSKSVSGSKVEFKLDQEFFLRYSNKNTGPGFLYSEIKADYCLVGMSNLVRKNQYLQLVVQLLEGQITDDEFELEIKNSPDEYIIKVNNHASRMDCLIISDVIKDLNFKRMTTEDISEIFSLNSESVKKCLSPFSTKLISK